MANLVLLNCRESFYLSFVHEGSSIKELSDGEQRFISFFTEIFSQTDAEISLSGEKTGVEDKD